MSQVPAASEVVIDSLKALVQLEVNHKAFAAAVVAYLVANLLPSVPSPSSQTLLAQETWMATAIAAGSFRRPLISSWEELMPGPEGYMEFREPFPVINPTVWYCVVIAFAYA